MQDSVSYGRFGGARHSYTVTASLAPNTVRVWSGDPLDDIMVCTISGVSTDRPRASFSGLHSGLPEHWKRMITVESLRVFHEAGYLARPGVD
ncbi:hypothetical protein [Stackebrandtia soli]|uniref:hypothetical protein n=1 Tax=Stackebrandtia soli TaxID=1892856 RepID=UPI0039ECE7AC